MPRAPLPPVAPEAVAVALRALRKAEKKTRKDPARWLPLTREQREAFAAGTLLVKRDSKLAENIVMMLLEPLGATRNQTRAERLRQSLRGAFGEKAYGRAVSFWAGLESIRRQNAQAQRPAPSPAPQTPASAAMLGQGVHVAPFLSSAGNVVLVAIGDGGHLGFMAECGTPSGGLQNGEIAADEFTARDKVELFDSGSVMMELLSGRSRDVSLYGYTPFPRGIHQAPWRPWGKDQGLCLVAVDHQHRLIASTDVSTPTDASAARRELAVLLDLLAPEPYRDSYDDGEEDEDCCGEGWKHGR